MTIYTISWIVAPAYPLAVTGNNNQFVVEAAGTLPYNRDVFPDSEFAPTCVTDRPLPAKITFWI